MLFRVRHNPSDETIGKNFGDRKADSIESDRAFASHIMRELSWPVCKVVSIPCKDTERSISGRCSMPPGVLHEDGTGNEIA